MCQASNYMKLLNKIADMAIVVLAGCSSYGSNKPVTPDLGDLTQLVDSNKDTIESQDNQLSELRESLRHETAEIDVNASQAQHLYIGPRLASPY